MKSIHTIILIVFILFTPGRSWANKNTIPEAELKRISEAGKLAGRAAASGLDWRSYYIKFMERERKKDWNEHQIGFIGSYFGAVQGRTAQKMKTISPEEVEAIKKELKNKTDFLNNIRFFGAPKFHTRVLWYKLGDNPEPFEKIIVYPVNVPNPTLFLRIQHEKVVDIEVRRVVGTVGSDKFNSDNWKANKNLNRRNMVADLITNSELKDKIENDIFSILVLCPC